jgi:hypothetical protein
MSYKITRNLNRSGTGDTIIPKIVGVYPDLDSALAKIGTLKPVYKKDRSIWLYEESTPTSEIEKDFYGHEAVGFIRFTW